jgi:hypothetical protein
MKRPRQMALMMKVIAMSTRYAVSQWRQCRRSRLNRTPDFAEERDAGFWTSRSSWHVTMGDLSDGCKYGGRDSAFRGKVVTVGVTIFTAARAGFSIYGKKPRDDW